MLELGSTISPFNTSIGTHDDMEVVYSWQPILLLIMSLLGFLGNVFSFFVFRDKQSKSIADFFIIYIAFSDSNENLIAIIAASWAINCSEWPWETCYIELFWRFWVIQAWLLNGVLAVNRYYAVIIPFDYSNIFTRKVVYIVFVSIGVAALACVIPGFVFCSVGPRISDDFKSGYQDYNAILELVLVLILSAVMVFCYAKIIMRMEQLNDSTATKAVHIEERKAEPGASFTQVEADGENEERPRRQQTILIEGDSTGAKIINRAATTITSIAVTSAYKAGEVSDVVKDSANQVTLAVGALAKDTRQLIADNWSDDSNKQTEAMFRNICITFVLCSLPYQLATCITSFAGFNHSQVADQVKYHLMVWQQVNFVISPLYYYKFNRNFRHTSKRWLSCGHWRKRANQGN